MEDLHEFLGIAIKKARMDCGLTQEALAERAGISCRYLMKKSALLKERLTKMYFPTKTSCGAGVT